MTKKPKTEEVIVQSIRTNGRAITCKWTQGGDSYAVTFHDNPLPSFNKALAALAPHVCSLCELPAKDADKVETTGVTIVPLGEDNEQALITAKKKIRNGKRVFNISTPLLAMWPAADADKKGTDAMDDDEAKAITKFAAEGKKYIIGDRAQGKLAIEKEDEDETAGESNQTEFPPLAEPPAKG